MERKKAIFLAVGVAVLVLFAAGASAFVTKQSLTPDKTVVQKTASKKVAKKEQIVWNEQRPAPQQQQQVRCNDGNIVGAVLGGVGGGIAGNQFGKGNGKTAATIGGTLGGAYVGGKYIPTQNVTCR